MAIKGLTVANPYGAFIYDVQVLFCGDPASVEVAANSMTEAARLVQNAGFELIAP